MTTLKKAKIKKLIKTKPGEIIRYILLSTLAIAFFPIVAIFLIIPNDAGETVEILSVAFISMVIWSIVTFLYYTLFPIFASLLLTSATLLILALIVSIILVVSNRANDIKLSPAELRAYKLKSIL